MNKETEEPQAKNVIQVGDIIVSSNEKLGNCIKKLDIILKNKRINNYLNGTYPQKKMQERITGIG